MLSSRIHTYTFCGHVSYCLGLVHLPSSVILGRLCVPRAVQAEHPHQWPVNNTGHCWTGSCLVWLMALAKCWLLTCHDQQTCCMTCCINGSKFWAALLSKTKSPSCCLSLARAALLAFKILSCGVWLGAGLHSCHLYCWCLTVSDSDISDVLNCCLSIHRMSWSVWVVNL